MFCLSEIEHTLRLPPSLLNLPLHDAIKGELETLFIDKVISNLGLCISIYDIKEIDGGFIFAGHGASTYTVKFRMIMFRPFIGEVITAVLKEADANGVRLSVGFFDDIYVPAHKMLDNSKWQDDPELSGYHTWLWTYEDSTYSMDDTDEIRFKVERVHYPAIPVVEASNLKAIEEGGDSKPNEQENDHLKKPFAPMVITVSSSPVYFSLLLKALFYLGLF
ncbi:DNA-directed RNA polymerase III subunit RPC8 [Impatiens glandulifera]|uniref:DNA-directed RNA polymerase III subunit RPC8 n=1 Tax=Impatiens glandulifera TaxID=253017 RepID=UPI001FB0A1D1|nr:DNA-directed RNA polymerase III subunit RPC8 [Impatiens glandulifera]